MSSGGGVAVASPSSTGPTTPTPPRDSHRDASPRRPGSAPGSADSARPAQPRRGNKRARSQSAPLSDTSWAVEPLVAVRSLLQQLRHIQEATLNAVGAGASPKPQPAASHSADVTSEGGGDGNGEAPHADGAGAAAGAGEQLKVSIGWIVSKLPVPHFAVRLFTFGLIDPASAAASGAAAPDAGANGAGAGQDAGSGDACGAGDEELSLSLVGRSSPSLHRMEQWLVRQVTQRDGTRRGYQVLSIVVHKALQSLRDVRNESPVAIVRKLIMYLRNTAAVSSDPSSFSVLNLVSPATLFSPSHRIPNFPSAVLVSYREKEIHMQALRKSLMHHAVNVTGFEAAVCVPDPDCSIRRMHDRDTDEESDGSGSDVFSPHSFPPSPNARSALMTNFSMFTDDVLYRARDELRSGNHLARVLEATGGRGATGESGSGRGRRSAASAEERRLEAQRQAVQRMFERRLIECRRDYARQRSHALASVDLQARRQVQEELQRRTGAKPAAANGAAGAGAGAAPAAHAPAPGRSPVATAAPLPLRRGRVAADMLISRCKQHTDASPSRMALAGPEPPALSLGQPASCSPPRPRSAVRGPLPPRSTDVQLPRKREHGAAGAPSPASPGAGAMVPSPATPAAPPNALARLATFNPRDTHPDMRLTCGNHAVLKVRSSLHRSARAALPLPRYQRTVVHGRTRDVCTYFEVSVSRLVRGKTGAEAEAFAAAQARSWRSKLRTRRASTVSSLDLSSDEWDSCSSGYDTGSDHSDSEYDCSSRDGSVGHPLASAESRPYDDASAVAGRRSRASLQAARAAGDVADSRLARGVFAEEAPVAPADGVEATPAASVATSAMVVRPGATPAAAAVADAGANAHTGVGVPVGSAVGLPRPADLAAAGGVCVGVSTSAMPLNALVGSAPASAGLNSSGHIVCGGEWQPCAGARFAYGSTIGVLARWQTPVEGGMAADGGTVRMHLTFTVDGRRVGTTELAVPAGVDVFPTVTLLTPGARAMAHFNASDVLYPAPLVTPDDLKSSAARAVRACDAPVVLSVDGSVLATPPSDRYDHDDGGHCPRRYDRVR